MLVTAFIFGLLSSLHCVGMCGPIAFALPVHKGTASQKWCKILYYHLGRLTTYAVIGLIFGMFGRAFAMAGLQQTLSIAAGGFLIFVALFYKKIWNRLERNRPNGLLKVFRKVYQNLAQSTASIHFYSLGLINGLLPCGTLYMALIGAIALGSLTKGALYMFVFGLGTVPLMVLLMTVKLFSTLAYKKYYATFVPVMLFTLGALFILRGMGLGIAFVSPAPNSLQVQFVPVGCH